MPHLSLTKYAEYIFEKAGIQLIEWDHSFITYSIEGDVCMIHDLWVDSEYRRKGIAWNMADYVTIIAKENGCKKLVSTLMVHSNKSDEALKSQLAYGFKLIGSDSEKLYLAREI